MESVEQNKPVLELKKARRDEDNEDDDDDLQKKTKAKRSVPASIASSLKEININLKPQTRNATSISSSLAANHQVDRPAGRPLPPRINRSSVNVGSSTPCMHLRMDSSKDALISSKSQVFHPCGGALRNSSSGFLSRSPPPASNSSAAAASRRRNSNDRGCLVKDASGRNSTTKTAAPQKRVSFQLDEATRDGRRGQARMATAKQGGGFFGFLASACRECQAFDPTKHVQSSSRNNSNRHGSRKVKETLLLCNYQ